jgi:aminoacyl-tRNA hydrolase
VAPFYRALLLRRVVFIAVTGSCGKTTTKELIAAVLATRYKGKANPASFNVPPHLDRTILRVLPWDDYCLLEIAPTKNGNRVFDRVLHLVRPQIGVVTVIGTDHIKVFRSIEAIAAEKAKMIASLPVHGTAILNFDDPHVRKMQSLCAGQVMTYGQAADVKLQAENIRAAWPDCLALTLRYEGQSVPVRTQLYGAHLVCNVLAAVAVGLAMGVPLAVAAEAVATVPPFRRRMGPIHHPDGFAFIRDDYKAPFWSIPATLQFIREARAARKALVIGTISDITGTPEAAYVSIARQALEVADLVLFVGRNSSKCLKAKRHPKDEALQAFYSPEAAARYLHGWLRAGDLVLLKGSDVDRLDVMIAKPQSLADAPGADFETHTYRNRPRVVVGLGNAGETYEQTLHNAGHQVLDLLARSLGGTWTQEHNAIAARIEHEDGYIYLLKPLTAMNTTGPVLVQIGQLFGFGPAECILVHDDIDLPMGSVRVRTRASDAGHRGVRSVLEAFQTDEVRRVRIGVGRPGQGKRSRDYVLKTFPSMERSVFDRACIAAANRVLDLLGVPKSGDQPGAEA